MSTCIIYRWLSQVSTIIYSFQINFSAKQSTFHWQRCSDLPVYAYDAQVVLLEKKVYFASEIEMETVPPYSTGQKKKFRNYLCSCG